MFIKIKLCLIVVWSSVNFIAAYLIDFFFQVAEKMLETKYSTFGHRVTSHTAVRCESYSLPEEVAKVGRTVIAVLVVCFVVVDVLSLISIVEFSD